MDDPLSKALACLPHGPEFRFVDRLLSLDPGKNGSGQYTVRQNEPFLRGHFPGDPVFPGVLLIESAAQLAGIVAQCDPQIPPLVGLKLTALRGIKILGSARPGEVIRLEARIIGRLSNLVQAEASAHLMDRVLMEGNLVLSGEPPRENSAATARRERRE
jgi:3-hydroxyacyl-[acyl-carrier-protein] dehydratase